jgi:WD40 repeat protein
MPPGLAGRLSVALVGWHPRRWRDRYGEEMLDVLGQHQPTARTVASLWASAVSAQLDPAYRTDRLSLPRLRRAALIAAVAAASLAPVLSLIGYQAWQDDHWHPAAGENLLSAGFSAHAAILVTAFGQAIDGTDMVWDVTDLSRPRRLSQFEGGQPTALSPDSRTVATVTFDDQTVLWNVTDPRHPARIATLSASGSGLRRQEFSPDGRILAAGYYDQVFLWDVASPARPRLLRILDAPATSPAGNSNEVPFSPQALAFAPGGNLLAVLTSHGIVLVYNLADPVRPVRTATVRGLLDRARYPDGQTQPDEVLCAACTQASYAVAFAPGGHTLTVVVDREEMSANSGRDTIFDWPVTGSGTLGTATVGARDVADSQPLIAPSDRTVLGSSPDSHAWHAWALP